MKNIFKDTDDLKPVLKNIIELDDDRQIMLFEYIVTKKDMTEENFNEMIIEMKGDSEMASLAEMWTNRIRLEEAKANIKMGLEVKFNQISDKLFLLIQKIKEIDKLKEIQKALFVMNDAEEFKKFVKKTI